MDSEEKEYEEYEFQIHNEMTPEEIAAIEKDYKIPSSQVPVPNAISNYQFAVTDKKFAKDIVARDLKKEYDLKDHPSFGGKVTTNRSPLENPEIQEISDKRWKEMLDQVELFHETKERTSKSPKPSLDSLLSKVAEQEDVNNAYKALKKITNKANAVGALSVILAERLERLIAQKQ